MTEQTTNSKRDIQAELLDLRRHIAELERSKHLLEQQISSGGPVAEMTAPVTTQEELAQTLQTFVRRVAMILQSEKCVIMIYEPESGELVAQLPALRLTDEEVAAFHLPADAGISGEAFHDGHPIICHDLLNDPRSVKEKVALLNVRDSLTVPMIIERRNENQQVVERNIIGVIHVFNKRYGMKFTEEDIRLLTVLARNAAAVISSARAIFVIDQQKKQLEYTLQSMTSGLLVVARNERIQIFNTAAAQILGMNPGTGVGQNYHEVVENDEVKAFIGQALEHEGEIAKEFVINERYFSSQTAMVRDDKRNVLGLLCIFNDVTELRNVERMKSDFVSTVSHELRTPLTAIKGFTRTLLDSPDETFDADTRREFYEIIDSECDRLVRLISDLLNVSRIERGLPLQLQYTELKVQELVDKCLNFQRSYTEKHALVADVPTDLPEIIADKDKVDQIITNLISNAIKYSPEGGTITTRVRDEGPVLQFSVSDEGMGIPPDHIDKVFQRFHRVHSGDSQRVGGTGIGLFLVKSLVQAHGGAIWVDSKLGSGSTFYFTLPKTPPEKVGG